MCARKPIVGGLTDEEEETSNGMIKILLLLLLSLLYFCRATSNCRSALVLYYSRNFFRSLFVKSSIGFKFFLSVALLNHAGKSTRVKGA